MRRYLRWGAVIVACGVLVWQLQHSDSLNWRLFDFVEYWTAGRLTLRGDNPYDITLIRKTQLEADPEAARIEMWNPPWTLIVVLPFGAMPPRPAHVIWLILHLTALVYSADAAWRCYGGSREKRWIAWIVAFTFAPTYFALTAGQISPLLLLGAVVFLQCERTNRLALAGAAAALLAIKPHITYLFWIALLVWAVSGRHWMVLAGGALAGIVATAVPLLFNPQLLAQYWHTLSSEPPARYDSPTLGMALRLALGRDQFWLQFLPMIPGIIWFVWYWRTRTSNWDWAQQLPALLFASLLTAPYGAWPFDLVVLLLPVMQSAVLVVKEPSTNRARVGLCLYAAIQIAALVLIFSGFAYFRFIWMTPALLLAWLVATRDGERAQK